ncbi:glycosyltransferase [Cellulosimicrobium sp. CUA-896]|uniref:glycosyltransferase n=1 Tax=Cellulosimicrobium sp. CUA-896 TaxID=1517881 RepID=UPI003513C0ED
MSRCAPCCSPTGPAGAARGCRRPRGRAAAPGRGGGRGPTARRPALAVDARRGRAHRAVPRAPVAARAPPAARRRAHDVAQGRPARRRAARAAGRPLVWHVHDRIAPDYLPGVLVRVVRALARVAPAAVVANSRATAATLPVRARVAYPGFAPEQAQDLPAAVPDRGVPDRGAPDRDGPGTGAPVVVMVGRLSPTKGQLEVVRAMPAVRAAVPGARLRIVGEPAFGAQDYARRVREEVSALGLEDAVDLVGFVPDTRADLDRAAVCVHASPVPEPFGQVVVEAMVRGVPVVATRAGGVEEILTDESDESDETGEPLGLLVAPGDVDAIAAAVRDVLTEPEAARARADRRARRPGAGSPSPARPRSSRASGPTCPVERRGDERGLSLPRRHVGRRAGEGARLGGGCGVERGEDRPGERRRPGDADAGSSRNPATGVATTGRPTARYS